MMKVFAPFMKNFPYLELKDMYEENQELIGDDQSFDDVILRTMFFGFMENETVLGGIYFYENNSRTFVNAFAGRKTYKQNEACLKWTLNGFRCPIYARTRHRYVRLRLLKLGFKKVEENIYKYERTN